MPVQFNKATGDVRYCLQSPSGDWVEVGPAVDIDNLLEVWPYWEPVYNDDGVLIGFFKVDKPTEGMVLEQAL